MERRVAIFGMALVSAFFGSTLQTLSQGWAVISKDELDREREYSKNQSKDPSVVAQPSSVAGAPIIEVQQPDQNKPIKSPVSVIVTFTASQGSKIDPSSMRILYGLLKLDITSRVRSYAKVDENGVRAENAQLPSGTHNITFSISDDKGRTATRAITVSVI